MSFDPPQAGWTCQPDDGFIDLVGPFWRREEEGRPLYGFLAEPRHANKIGVVQGGMLMTIADRAMGMLAWDSQPVVTVQFSMEFLQSAQIGEFVVVRSEVTRRTRSLVFLRAALTVDERTVATASGLWKVLHRPAA